MAFDDIAWFPLSLGLTALGLVLAVVVGRRRGLVAGARVTAWALLPFALWLVGGIRLVWRVGTEVSRFVTGFAFSPKVWLGVVLVGVSAALFAVTTVVRRRGLDVGTDAPASAALEARPRKPADSGGEFDEIEELLRRRGIS